MDKSHAANKRKLKDLNYSTDSSKNVAVEEAEIDFTNTAVDEGADDSSDADDYSSDNDSGDEGGSSEDEGEEEKEDETDSENEATSGYGVESGDDSDELSFEEDGISEEDSDEGIIKNSTVEKGPDERKQKNFKPAKSCNESVKVNILDKRVALKNKLKYENVEKQDAAKAAEDDEYKSDSSDEEDIRNTVGNIPMKWYDEYNHLGYDWDGKQILKPPQGDALDNFLKRMEDPNFWRTVKDPQTGQDVILCDADMDLIQRIQSQKVPDPEFDEYAPWVEWFSSEVMKMPVRKFPEHKRSFLPSRSEKHKVSRIVHAIKMGWIKVKPKRKQEGPQFYMLWGSDDGAEQMRRIHNHIPAPKRNLPGHAESYNPPSEYLFDSRELKRWHKLQANPWKRKLHFIPEKYGSLREVPAYRRYTRERFLRCLDLYLCPRARKMKLMIEPEDLVPQLPSPQDLQPFPTAQSLVYEGHSDLVRCVTVEPRGQYLASGSDDLTVKIWEVATARCVRTVAAGGVVRSVSWCPSQALSLLAVAADRKVLLVNPRVGDRLVVAKTDTLLRDPPPQQDVIVPERVKTAVQWEEVSDELWNTGVCIIINHFKEVKQVAWHGRGDYFATVMPDGQNRSVLIHQLSKRRSQIPFSRTRGLVQCVLFHPIRPIFFVATQKHVRVYDLVKQEMIKKLMSNSKWISSIAVHPGGDNVLVGTYDRKMLWFDLDLSTKPYQTLRLHGTAVRSVAYHPRYPLFASGSDDRSVIVCHGMVYNDLLQNPLIVPLKRLSYHEPRNDFGVLDLVFHPTQPWVFSSGGDHTIRLYT
ncbi:ribosome biogenesis protein BOP1 homolog [Bacillus rossius redtenbacheri]|uniref:ribosome biogenesis protein BOP1 homolog n=1 Tax=Bacillus rossius redtenbacheri TaxID=93214 RepID=UPI002FDE2A46